MRCRNPMIMEENKKEAVEPRSYPLNQIYMYLTEGCNLRCRHCWISPTYQAGDPIHSSLDLHLFRSTIEQARPMGLSGIKLTGGEPLLHPRIDHLLEFLRAKELSLSVETNGVPCTAVLAREISRCKDPFVSVSLDAAEPEIHEWVRGVKGCFDGALAGIRNLVSAGVRPQLIMTLMRRNREQMEPFVRLAESLGAASVKFNIVQPTARGRQMHKAGETLTIKELVVLGRWVETVLCKTTELPLFYGHPAAFRPLGKILGEKGDGCAVCGILGIIGILADGSYALCGIGQTVPQLVFGHAARDRLEEVWRNSAVLREIRDGLPRRLAGICGRCIMIDHCLGSCMAQNYYSNGTFWAPYWYCDRAHEEDLFPETRIRPKPERAQGIRHTP